MRDASDCSGSSDMMSRPSASSHRQPLVRLAELALHVLQQVPGTRTRSRLKGSYGTLKNVASAAPRSGMLHLELVEQDRFQVQILAAGRALRRARSRPTRAPHSATRSRTCCATASLAAASAAAEGDGQRLGKLRDALVHHGQKGGRLVVDDLDHADQVARLRIEYRRDQHLLGAVAGLVSTAFRKLQMRVVGLQLRVVVDITYVQDALWRAT